MLKLLRLIFWLAVVVTLVIVIDQALLRTRLETPVLSDVQQFYVDFRGRLLSLAGIDKPQDSIGRVIEKAPDPRTAPAARGQRYFYVDEHGDLQFVDRYEQVPPRYRKDAQPLAE